MYERTSYPATPKWARHMLRLSNASKIPVDASVRDLARQTDYDMPSLPASIRLGRKECDAIQYLLDYNGRAVLVDNKGISYAQYVSAIAATILDSKTIWIVCNGHSEIAGWRSTIKSVAPNDPILARVGPEEFSNATANPIKEGERKWLITSYKALLDSSIISEYKVDHLIFDKDDRDLPYDSTDALSGACLEIKRTTMVFQATDFWVNPNDYKSQSVMGLLSTLLSDYMRLSSTMSKIPLMFGTSQNVAMYFRKRARRYEPLRVFEASGVCFDLVTDKTSTFFTNVFSNNMLVTTGAHSKRRSEVINNYMLQEDKLCTRLGKDADGVVEAALAGDATARAGLDTLKTQEWAKQKASLFYNSIREVNTTNEKMIVVAKNPHIRKYIATSLNIVDIDEGDDATIAMKSANFVYPHAGYKEFEVPKTYACRISNLVMTEDVSALDPLVLENANYVVFTEFDYDASMISDYIALSQVFDFKIIFGTMRGTFEEALADKLLNFYY